MMSFSFIPLGARYMIMSSISFALMGVFVKVAFAHGIPVLEIVAARALVSALLSYADVKRKGIPLLGCKKSLLLARGLVGALALVCVYYALVMMPFADATVLQYLHPMFTAILAILFLREKLQWSTVLCILFSFSGLLMIVRPDFLFGQLSAAYSLLATLAGVAGALGSAVAYVLVRKLSATEDTSVIIFYFPIIALPLSLLLLGDNMVMPQGWTWVVLIMVGISTQIGQIGLTKAMQTETAGRATSFSYLQVMFAVIFGLAFFNEVPTLWTLFGAMMILVGALINVLVHKTG